MKKAEVNYINNLLAEYEAQLATQAEFAPDDVNGMAQFRGQVALLKRIKSELNI